MVQITTIFNSQATETISHSEVKESNGRWSFFGSCSESLKNLVNRVIQIKNSILGQALVNTIGETVGGWIGSNIGSMAGWHFYSPLTLTAGGSATLYCLTCKTSQATKAILLGSTVMAAALVLSTQSPENFLSGENLLAPTWTIIGETTGTILGGYFGLALAGGAQTFWDASEPQNSYSVKVVKYLSAGQVMNAILAQPPSSCAGYPLRFVRQLSITSIQLSAYYSPAVIQVIKEAGNKKKKTLLTDILTEILAERCNGSQSAEMARKISDLIVAPLNELSNYLSAELKVGSSCRSLLTGLIGNGIETVLDPKSAPTFVLRSFMGYAKILKTVSIQQAHHEFELAFSKDLQANLKYKTDLIAAIQEKIKEEYPSQTLMEGMINFVLTQLLSQAKTQELAALLIKKIQEAEVEFIGFPLLSQHRAEFIKEILAIHIQNYVIFALSHYNKFDKPLTLMEERQILLDLSQASFSLYFNDITPFAATTQKIADLAIHTLFEVKRTVPLIFKKQSKPLLKKPVSSLLMSQYFDITSSEDNEFKLEEIGTKLTDSIILHHFFDKQTDKTQVELPLLQNKELKGIEEREVLEEEVEVSNALVLSPQPKEESISSLLMSQYFDIKSSEDNEFKLEEIGTKLTDSIVVHHFFDQLPGKAQVEIPLLQNTELKEREMLSGKAEASSPLVSSQQKEEPTVKMGNISFNQVYF